MGNRTLEEVQERIAELRADQEMEDEVRRLELEHKLKWSRFEQAKAHKDEIRELEAERDHLVGLVKTLMDKVAGWNQEQLKEMLEENAGNRHMVEFFGPYLAFLEKYSK